MVDLQSETQNVFAIPKVLATTMTKTLQTTHGSPEDRTSPLNFLFDSLKYKQSVG